MICVNQRRPACRQAGISVNLLLSTSNMDLLSSFKKPKKQKSVQPPGDLKKLEQEEQELVQELEALSGEAGRGDMPTASKMDEGVSEPAMPVSERVEERGREEGEEETHERVFEMPVPQESLALPQEPPQTAEPASFSDLSDKFGHLKEEEKALAEAIQQEERALAQKRIDLEKKKTELAEVREEEEERARELRAIIEKEEQDLSLRLADLGQKKSALEQRYQELETQKKSLEENG